MAVKNTAASVQAPERIINVDLLKARAAEVAANETVQKATLATAAAAAGALVYHLIAS